VKRWWQFWRRRVETYTPSVHYERRHFSGYMALTEPVRVGWIDPNDPPQPNPFVTVWKPFDGWVPVRDTDA
jgi:hypothetical protein